MCKCASVRNIYMSYSMSCSKHKSIINQFLLKFNFIKSRAGAQVHTHALIPIRNTTLDPKDQKATMVCCKFTSYQVFVEHKAHSFYLH